ncbi:hypothetical protein CHUAL_004870 [Chamberlinius hualienensis]
MLMYFRCYLSCLASFLAFMCIAMVISFPSPAFPDINKGNYGFKLAPNEMSWLASFTGLFAVPGSMIIVPIMDSYGRKFATAICTLPMTIGWLFIVCSFNVTTFAIGRALLGVAVGMISVAVVVYISELSPKKIRGRVAVITFMFFNLGAFLVNLLGAFVNWRWIGVFCLLTVSAVSISLIFMFETPRWLMERGRAKCAIRIMELTWELDEIPLIPEKYIEPEVTLNIKLKTFIHNVARLVQSPLWKPFVITQMLMVFQQFTGYAYISTYSVSIFSDAASSENSQHVILSNPHYQSCMLFVGGVIGNFIALNVIDKFGRRVLLISSGLIISLSLTVVGTYYYMQLVNELLVQRHLSWLPLTFLMVITISFSFSYNLIPSLLVSELFAINMRGITSGMVSFNHNIVFFIIVKIFSTNSTIPNYGIFWIFAMCTLLSVIFVGLFVPETKGRSLEELQHLYSTYPKTTGLKRTT